MSHTFTATLPGGAAFAVHPDETLLAAAQRAQWAVPYGCRNGNCEACEARLLKGTVLQRDKRIEAGDFANKILLCQCSALSDVTIELNTDPVPGNLAQSRRFYAQLVNVTAAGNYFLLSFALPAGRKPTLIDGQYAMVEAESGDLRCAIDRQFSSARQLLLTTTVDTGFTVGSYFYLRYPLGSGIAP